MQTRRERHRIATIDEIKAAAWKQIGETGAAGLSLRGIAREIGMTAPGLYRYFSDRDALVTALLIDTFDSFSTALETARDRHAADDHTGRFRAICRAYFEWGTENPRTYIFLFSTPVPGYQFAPELEPAALRSFLILQGVLGEADAAGKLAGMDSSRLPPPLKSHYDALHNQGLPYTPAVTQLALSVWAYVHGIESLYLYGYFDNILGAQMGAFVEFEIEKLMSTLGLE